jgi:hypothetical protein
LSTAGGKTAVPARTQSDVSYREPLLLLHNDDRGNFQNMAQLAGPIFQQGFRARGLAVGDWDNDGRTDIIFTCLNDSLGVGSCHQALSQDRKAALIEEVPRKETN